MQICYFTTVRTRSEGVFVRQFDPIRQLDPCPMFPSRLENAEEVESAQAIIAELGGRLDEAVARMEEAQEALDKAKARVVEIRREYLARKAWLTPIGRMPTEILGLIIEAHASLEWWAPAVDRRVCRPWNEAAMSTPRAWSNVLISPTAKPMLPHTVAVQRWLERGGTSPLYVTIVDTTRRRSRAVAKEGAERIYDLIVNPPLHPKFTVLLYNCRNLRHLRIEGNSRNVARSIYIGSLLLNPDNTPRMPHLATLTLSHMDIVFDNAATISFSLTTLSLSHVNGLWLDFVQCCKDTLRNLTIDDCAELRTTNMPSTFILPSLTSLRLVNDRSFRTVAVMPFLATIHETGREIKHLDKLADKVLPSVIEYTSHESQRSSVETDNADQPSYSWKTMLSLYPNLEWLRAKEPMDSLKELLLLLAASPNSCPNLKCLEIHPVYAPPPPTIDETPELGNGSNINHGWKPWDIPDLKSILARRVVTNSVPLTVQYPSANCLIASPARSAPFCEYHIHVSFICINKGLEPLLAWLGYIHSVCRYFLFPIAKLGLTGASIIRMRDVFIFRMEIPFGPSNSCGVGSTICAVL
jgi:hypothetical protein